MNKTTEDTIIRLLKRIEELENPSPQGEYTMRYGLGSHLSAPIGMRTALTSGMDAVYYSYDTATREEHLIGKFDGRERVKILVDNLDKHQRATLLNQLLKSRGTKIEIPTKRCGKIKNKTP